MSGKAVVVPAPKGSFLTSIDLTRRGTYTPKEGFVRVGDAFNVWYSHDYDYDYLVPILALRVKKNRIRPISVGGKHDTFDWDLIVNENGEWEYTVCVPLALLPAKRVPERSDDKKEYWLFARGLDGKWHFRGTCAQGELACDEVVDALGGWPDSEPPKSAWDFAAANRGKTITPGDMLKAAEENPDVN